MVESAFASKLTFDDAPSDQIVRQKLTGHTGVVNSIQISSNVPFTNHPVYLSASDDGSTRIWDSRTNKGIVLLKGVAENEVSEVTTAKWSVDGGLVVSAQGNMLNFFDVRQPSLILKSLSVQDQSTVPPTLNTDDINDVSI